MRVLHAIHDFLPAHRAGSEIYAAALAAEQARRHDVFVLAAEYDPATPHGTIRWRRYEQLPVVEVVNNWAFDTFAETWRSPRLNAQLEHVLHAVRPDVLHVHNLLNLSFDLPRLARARGMAVVATLHDYTLVCPSGGQRLHVQESHVCAAIDPERCSRCFAASPWARQMQAARLTGRGGAAGRVLRLLRRTAPVLTARAGARLPVRIPSPVEFTARLAGAREVFDQVDLFVAPSPSLGEEFDRHGLPRARLEIADYGFAPGPAAPPPTGRAPLRIGFVGTLVHHKGVHVLLAAARRLRPPFEVHVHGALDVFPAYAAELRRLAEGLPVTFHGGFPGEERPRVYGSFDVLVVPSLWPENSPLVVHEAFQHGRAVVGARSGGIVDLVRDGVNGRLYAPFSAEELAAALQPLVDDPAGALTLASRHPAVRTIAHDAAEWDARYAALLGHRTACATT